MKQFFTEKWAPEVSGLIKPTRSSMQSVLDQMLYDIEDLDICEVVLHNDKLFLNYLIIDRC